MLPGKTCNRCGWMWGIIGVTALLTTGVLSQSHEGHRHEHGQHTHEHQQQQQPSPEQMQRWMKYSQPSEHHRKLQPLIGTWNQTVRIRMTPNADPEVLESTATYEWIMGGRYVQGTYEGNFMGEPFQGMDLLGYDNYRQQYVALWIDNLGTGFMTTTGWYNDQTDTLIMHGSVDDTMQDFPNRPLRTETEFKSDDHIVYRSYTVDRQGNEFQSMEIVCRRAERESRTGAHPRRSDHPNE